ncbi:MAG TPA: SulP family inorganic anion transporter [Planctomycetota bacterium]|nr:SulP family inorganic anion transporter [Planctomycetota bacterium]
MNVKPSLRQDLPAGVVVFFVAVPLCLGIALASGAPLFSGLIAGIVGGILVGALSGSPLGVSGPAAGLAVIVFDAILELGSFQALLLATVLAGVLQLVLGAARAGVLGYFFPSSVIKGMLAGIGILIVLKQIPHAVGWDLDPMGEMEFSQPDGQSTFTELPLALGHIVPAAALIAGVALLVLVLWDRVLAHRGRVFRVVQGPVAAVGLGILYEVLTRRFAPDWSLSQDHLVNVPVLASLSEVGTLFTFPDWSQLSNPSIYSTAVVLAVVASIETLLCVEATDKLDPHKRTTPKNRELLAQGVGNIASGLIGGLPVTQVIVRSSANIQSGGQTKLSAIFHGVLIVVFVFLMPGLLNLIPLSVLAAILIVVGYKLAKPVLFLTMWRKGMSQFAPFVVTIVGMVLTDLLTGVLLGLGLALLIILTQSYRNALFLHYEATEGNGKPARIRMRLAEDVNFLNRGAIVRQIADIPDGVHVTIDMSHCASVDQDVLEVIDEFRKGADERGITLEVLHQAPAPARTPRRSTKLQTTP